MTTNLANASIKSSLTGATTSRILGDRFSDIFNVKDFGAKGDGVTHDEVAIQAAITAMYAANGGIVYFPPGNYIVAATIDITNYVSGSTSGIIRGAGRWSTYINGAINNGFIFKQVDGQGCPEEISNLSLVNTSTVIGTGALIINNNTCGRITNSHFGGMINILMPFNMFQTNIDNCTGESNIDATTGHTGTFGIAGYACNVTAYRTTSPFQAAIQLGGVNTSVISACSNENCTVAFLGGMLSGWASSCTVSNGAGGSGNILTVGGNLGTTVQPQFVAGAEIFMKGITTTADWGISPVDPTICTITETHNENATRTGTGYAGTYTISRSANISAAVPCVSRYNYVLAGSTILAYTSEASKYPIFAMSTGACSFIGCGPSGTPVECVDAFQNTGFTAHSGFYIFNASATSFISCSVNNNPYMAAWYFDSNKNNQVSIINCTGAKLADNVTGTSSLISNGSGSAGTILNVVSYTGSTIGIGMKVTGSGVSANTVVSGNIHTDGTLTGGGGTGTYRVNNSQLVTGTAITIHTGDDWILPTTDSGKTGVEFFNTTSANLPAGYTTGLNSLNRTFNSLPGQAGANNNIPVVDGMSYDIVDCNASTFLATAAGGGSGATAHRRVRYNAASAVWQVIG